MDKETIIERRLLNDITVYCELNELDTSEYINGMLRKAFMEDKWLSKDMVQLPIVKNVPKTTLGEELTEEKNIKKEEPSTNVVAPEKKDLYGE